MGAEVAGDGSVCAAITYCSIATISQPPTIRISHQCCIMEQITGLRIYIAIRPWMQNVDVCQTNRRVSFQSLRKTGEREVSRKDTDL